LVGYRNISSVRTSYDSLAVSNCGPDWQRSESVQCRQSECGASVDPLIIGLSAGVSAAVVVLAAIILLIFLWRRRHRIGKTGDSLEMASAAVQSLPQSLLWHMDPSRVDHEGWDKHGAIFRKVIAPSTSEHQIVEDLFYRYLHGQRFGNNGAIKSIYAVFNPKLASNFCSQRDILDGRLKSDPALFASGDWKRLDRSTQRQWVHECYCAIVSRIPWNSPGDRVPVIPMLHGTGQASAWKIVANGFSTLSQVDKGFYGNGMYFSSSASYVMPYLINKSAPALVVCMVCPGNTFPVVESRSDEKSLLGLPIRPGYQSHYVLTTADGNPCTSRLLDGQYFDELVIGQESQVVPVYVIELERAAVVQLGGQHSGAGKHNTMSGPGTLLE